jgi:hypothetical protein
VLLTLVVLVVPEVRQMRRGPADDLSPGRLAQQSRSPMPASAVVTRPREEERPP